MTEPLPSPIPPLDGPRALHASLRKSHRSVLLVIAGCAAVSALQSWDEAETAPDPTFTTLAIGLALGVILTRRTATSQVISPRASVRLTLSSYGFAIALALLGTFIAVAHAETQTGLVFALAAGIFCLRPPQPITQNRRTRPRPAGQP